MTVVRTMNPKLDEEREFLGFPLPPMFDLFGGTQEDCPIVIVAIYVP